MTSAEKYQRDKVRLKEYRDRRKFEALSTGLLYGRPVEQVIYDRYKYSAERRNVVFELNLEEFKSYWKKPCSYCGGEIQTIGLDRIDNDLGYIKENITPCCTVCNLSKRGMLAEDYISHCVKVAKKTRERLLDRPV